MGTCGSPIVWVYSVPWGLSWRWAKNGHFLEKTEIDENVDPGQVVMLRTMGPYGWGYGSAWRALSTGMRFF